MRKTTFVAALAVGAVALSSCGAPAGSGGGSNNKESDKPLAEAKALFDKDAKGPAPEVKGAQKGGVLNIKYSTVPETFDPSRQYYQDVNVILNLVTRRLTTFADRDGKTVLVPDLATDLGRQSSDKLSWTFTLKDGLKYDDGSEVKPEDVAYAIKRSFAKEELPGGPDYQREFLKDGLTYKGPFKSGDNFAGVEVKGKDIVFHLSKPMESFPYFASFTQFSPIPKAKDTKDTYGNKPLGTGPYKFKSYTQGQELQLEKNTNWDPNSDAARHQFVDGYTFKFGVDPIANQKAILASNGPDNTTLTWDSLDAQFVQDVTGAKKDQFVSGIEPCTSYAGIDVNKVPFEVRKAIAVAWPFDQIRKAAGITPLSYAPAVGLQAPQMPGFQPFSAHGLTGKGTGDPAKAKEMLKAAGKEGFELSWYYTQDNPISVKSNIARTQGLEAAGFKVKAIGAPKKEVRKLISQHAAPVNMMQGGSGWCYDWPNGDSVFPPLMSSLVMKGQKESSNFARIQDPALDKKMADISALPLAEQAPKWAALDKEIMETILPAIPLQHVKSNILFGKGVKNVIADPNSGMPELSAIYIQQ